MTYQHNFDIEEINLFQTEIEMQTKMIVSEIHAKQRYAKKTIEAENIRNLAEFKALAYKTKVLGEAKAYQV